MISERLPTILQCRPLDLTKRSPARDGFGQIIIHGQKLIDSHSATESYPGRRHNQRLSTPLLLKLPCEVDESFQQPEMHQDCFQGLYTIHKGVGSGAEPPMP